MLGQFMPLAGLDPMFARGDRVRRINNRKQRGVITGIQMAPGVPKVYVIQWTDGTESKEYADAITRAP